MANFLQNTVRRRLFAWRTKVSEIDSRCLPMTIIRTVATNANWMHTDYQFINANKTILDPIKNSLYNGYGLSIKNEN